MPARRSRPREDNSTSPLDVRNVRPDRRPMQERAGPGNKSPAAANGKRTGQACDRCRERKIKCDSQTGRCGPCKEHDLACEVTDRNTGERYRRNELQEYRIALSTEQDQNSRQREIIARLRKQIESLGELPVLQDDDPVTPEMGRPGGRTGSITAYDRERVGQNYLGAAGHPDLSMLQGSQMTLFGNAFDLDKFFVRREQNTAFELSQKEYKDHALGQMSARVPAFPPHEDALRLAKEYFDHVSFFTPVVHRPDFFQIIDQKYNEDADLDLTQTVIFHMVMSLIEFQSAVRNREHNGHLGETAKGRLIWCLTKVYQLLHDNTLAAMQALTLICLAMRSLQRPGPAWSFCDQVLTRAMELGLHRSLRTWKAEEQQRDPHQTQMRQRIFWSLMVVHVNISGNLGLAMRLRYEDIDIEIPKCTPDSIAGDADPNGCSWSGAPHGFELTQIMLQVYSTICTVRPSLVEDNKNAFQLNKQLNDLETSLPQAFLQLTAKTPLAYREYIMGLYLKLGMYATRLIVCHPRHLRSSQFENSAYHLDLLMRTSRSILSIAEELRMYQSLDTTVYYTMDFIYAIFVAIYVTAQQITHVAGLEGIKKEMQRWRAVLQDVGMVLGTGLALRDAIQVFTTRALDKIRENIEKSIKARGAASTSPMASIPSNPENVGMLLQYAKPITNPLHASQYHGSSEARPVSTDGLQGTHVHTFALPHGAALSQSRDDQASHSRHVLPHEMLGYEVIASCRPTDSHECDNTSEQHGTIPEDALIQPYEGNYQGALVWQSTIGMMPSVCESSPVGCRNETTVSEDQQFGLQTWPQYYLDRLQ